MNIRKPYDEKIYIGEKGFLAKWLSKLLFTLISVKVWGLVAATWISTCLLIKHSRYMESITQDLDKLADIPEKLQSVGLFEVGITGAQWVTFNTTLWALIFGMKEIFRITEKKDSTDKQILKEKTESKKILASMLPTSGKTNANQSTFTAEGLEIVGDEPDGN